MVQCIEQVEFCLQTWYVSKMSICFHAQVDVYVNYIYHFLKTLVFMQEQKRKLNIQVQLKSSITNTIKTSTH
jgi:hypothetical protein